MSAPTSTGHIVAYLSLDSTEWRRSIAQAKRDLDELRRQSDVDIRLRVDDGGSLAQLRAIRAELRELQRRARTDINIRTNAQQTSTQLAGTRRQANLLMDAIVLLGAAAVPIAGVAGGAMAGLLPVTISTALGIKGISDQLKSGALEGTQAAADIGVFKNELTTLKAVTSSGLLSGLHTSLAEVDPLFRAVNTDALIMSRQVGQIASSALPGVLSVLTQLSPLFQTFGSELIRGAEGFSRWAQSSDGVRNFVSYVQSELPRVESVLGSLLTLVSHLAQGLGPLGGLTLTSIGVLADAINSLPIGVLQTLLPMLVAVRVSMLAYRGVTAVMALASSAYVRTAGTAAAFGNTTMLAHLQARTAALTDAATQTAAAAVTARANYAAAVAAGTASASQIRSLGAAAVAAEGAAARAAVAAEMNAVRTLAAGRIAAAGWTTALGPIAALGIGLALLAPMFLGATDNSHKAAKAQRDFSSSVGESVQAMDKARSATVVNTLTSKGAYRALQDLKAVNVGTALSFESVTQRVAEGGDEYESMIKTLDKYADAHQNDADDTAARSAVQLAIAMRAAKGALSDKIKEQQKELELQRAVTASYLGGSAAAQAHARAMHMTGDAYLDAVSAARSNTEQTQAQTRAFQLQNDAMSLLSAAFDTLNGKTLDISDAKINFANSLATVSEGLKENAKAWGLNSEAGRKNQANVNQAIRSAQELGKAVSGGSQLTRDGIKATRDALQQERERLVAMGASKGAIERVDQALRGLANAKVKPVAIETGPAQKKIADLNARMNAIRQGNVPGLTANSAAGRAVLAVLQDRIDALQQNREPEVRFRNGQAINALAEVQAYLDGLQSKTINVRVVRATAGAPATGRDTGSGRNGTTARAAGGPVVGPGTGTSDQVPAVLTMSGQQHPYALSNGEWIATADAAARNRGALAAANRGATLAVVHAMATGGPVGDVKKKGSGKDATWSFNGQTYQSATAANNARNTALKTELKLIATIDTKGLAAFDRALGGTVDQAQSAFRTLYDSLNKAGASDRLLRNLQAANREIDKTIAHRQRLRDRLGGPAAAPTAYDALTTAKQARAGEASSVANTARGTFNIATSSGPDGAAPTQGSMLAGALQAANLVEKFYAGIKTLTAGPLGKSKTGQAMIRQIFEEGPGAYPQLQALLRETPAQLNQQAAAQARINAASSGLGNFAGQQVFGAQVAAAQGRVDTLRAQIAADDKRAERQGQLIAKAVRAGLRDLRIDLDGKKVNKGSTTGGNRNRRRK